MPRLGLPRALAALLVFSSSWALAAAPPATTAAATSITTTSALLNGTGVPAGEATTGWFRLSPTDPGACDDVFGARVPASGGTDLGAGTGSVRYSITTTGLVSGTTYDFCAIVSNASGKAFGTVLTFTVPRDDTGTGTGTGSDSGSDTGGGSDTDTDEGPGKGGGGLGCGTRPGAPGSALVALVALRRRRGATRA